MRWAAANLRRLLQAGEVEGPDRLGDQLAVAVGVERPADDPRGGLQRQLRDLRPDLLERARRLGRDLAPRLLEPALPLRLGLVAHPPLHRLTRAASFLEDLLGLPARLPHQLSVLLEQASRLVARRVGLVERAA